MNKKNIVTLFLVLFPLLIKAQNYNDALILSEPGLGASARALGMGNSYTALSEDFSAVFFNPAGLGLMKRLELSTNISFDQFNNDVDFINSRSKSDISNSSFSQIGFVFPIPTFRGSLVLAAGYNTQKEINSIVAFKGFNNATNSMIQDLTGLNEDLPYNLGLSYPVEDSDGNYLNDGTKIKGRLRQQGEIINEGDIGSWAFAGAIEIAKKMFFGAAFNIYSGSYIKSRKYTEYDEIDYYGSNIYLVPDDPETADFQKFKLVDKVDWELSGYDLKFGWLYQINKRVRLAATFKLPTTFTVKEKYLVDGFSEFGNDISFKSEDEFDSEYDIKSPMEISFGSAYNIFNTIISGQVTYMDYSEIEFSDGFEKEELSYKNEEIVELLDNVLSYNVGIEYILPKLNVRLRTGFIYMQSPFKGDNSNFDKKYFTLGFGVLTSRLVSLDVGYAFGWWKSFSDNYGNGQSRVYEDITTNKIMLSLSYRF
ncbi:MAG: outer membrane protein transport protein [Melioribacteraceae bacterium]|nr:outer membrane protein transport protein [Melioribacteraceae bacterium]